MQSGQNWCRHNCSGSLPLSGIQRNVKRAAFFVARRIERIEKKIFALYQRRELYFWYVNFNNGAEDENSDNFVCVTFNGGSDDGDHTHGKGSRCLLPVH
jgi:hypothetical protein